MVVEHNDTPIFDSLNAQHGILPEVFPPEPQARTFEQNLGAEALPDLNPRTPISQEGYSAHTQVIIDIINRAIMSCERTVYGQSFISYAMDNRPNIPSHEWNRFLEDVRKHN